jgi:hypothetical protein
MSIAAAAAESTVPNRWPWPRRRKSALHIVPWRPGHSRAYAAVHGTSPWEGRASDRPDANPAIVCPATGVTHLDCRKSESPGRGSPRQCARRTATALGGGKIVRRPCFDLGGLNPRSIRRSARPGLRWHRSQHRRDAATVSVPCPNGRQTEEKPAYGIQGNYREHYVNHKVALLRMENTAARITPAQEGRPLQ